jgi:hypothetical protein
MDEAKYVQIDSWHRIASRLDHGGFLTECGRLAGPGSPTSHDLRGNKTCESCFRIYEERPPVAEKPEIGGA